MNVNKEETIAIAIVVNHKQQFLITRRKEGQHLAGKWEFPGGKVESKETIVSAMVRELKEEVGITAIEFNLFDSLTFQYDQLHLNLHFYLVSQFEGNAMGIEGQELKWIDKDQFADYEFPKANIAIINKL